MYRGPFQAAFILLLHLDGGLAINRRPVAQVTVAIIPPRPDRTVFPANNRVFITGGSMDDIQQSIHLRRNNPLRGGPVAQLTVAVISPCPNRTIALQGHRMFVAGGN